MQNDSYIMYDILKIYIIRFINFKNYYDILLRKIIDKWFYSNILFRPLNYKRYK